MRAASVMGAGPRVGPRGLLVVAVSCLLALASGLPAASGASAATATASRQRAALPEAPAAERVEAVLLELDRTAGSEAFEHVLVRAFELFQQELDALEYEQAERLALSMHAHAQAGWSAWTLALISTRLGRHERALQLLEQQRAQAQTPQQALDVTVRLALAELGAGRRERARDLLGHALRQGSPDSRQILARMALAQGEFGRARALFGSLLPEMPQPEAPATLESTPWALRGWGLALLPAGEPAPERGGRPQEER